MTTPVLLELFAGFLTASMALWFVVLGRSALPVAPESRFDGAIVADLIGELAAEDPQDSPSSSLAPGYGSVAGSGRL